MNFSSANTKTKCVQYYTDHMNIYSEKNKRTPQHVQAKKLQISKELNIKCNAKSYSQWSYEPPCFHFHLFVCLFIWKSGLCIPVWHPTTYAAKNDPDILQSLFPSPRIMDLHHNQLKFSFLYVSQYAYSF